MRKQNSDWTRPRAGKRQPARWGRRSRRGWMPRRGHFGRQLTLRQRTPVLRKRGSHAPGFLEKRRRERHWQSDALPKPRRRPKPRPDRSGPPKKKPKDSGYGRRGSENELHEEKAGKQHENHSWVAKRTSDPSAGRSRTASDGGPPSRTMIPSRSSRSATCSIHLFASRASLRPRSTGSTGVIWRTTWCLRRPLRTQRRGKLSPATCAFGSTTICGITVWESQWSLESLTSETRPGQESMRLRLCVQRPPPYSEASSLDQKERQQELAASLMMAVAAIRQGLLAERLPSPRLSCFSGTKSSHRCWRQACPGPLRGGRRSTLGPAPPEMWRAMGAILFATGWTRATWPPCTGLQGWRWPFEV
mmetsp:Transcript_11144/g.31984  ORF Transcript_11144/g.31984 Transcript_11144/m.31984 type:complete len:361 (-) Transcript_11144:388-1470(-)